MLEETASDLLTCIDSGDCFSCGIFHLAALAKMLLALPVVRFFSLRSSSPTASAIMSDSSVRWPKTHQLASMFIPVHGRDLLTYPTAGKPGGQLQQAQDDECDVADEEVRPDVVWGPDEDRAGPELGLRDLERLLDAPQLPVGADHLAVGPAGLAGDDEAVAVVPLGLFIGAHGCKFSKNVNSSALIAKVPHECFFVLSRRRCWTSKVAT